MIFLARESFSNILRMVAIKKENIYMTRYLLSKKADTNIQDNKKNTIYHIAANTNKEMIEIVSYYLGFMFVANNTFDFLLSTGRVFSTCGGLFFIRL